MCSHPWTGIRINVASGNGMMGSYLKLKETDYAQCQFQGDDGGPRYYKAFVHASKRDGAPCWLVRMPEVWPNVKVLQMDIADKQIHVSLAFTGEHLISLKFRGKKTFDFLEEVVIAWDLKYDHDPLCRLCGFSFVHLAYKIDEKDWIKPMEETLGLVQPQAKARPKTGAVKKLVSHKGSSGIRPCISCGNCIAKNRTAAGYYSIDHNDFSDFTLQDDDTTRRTFEHLKHLHENSTAASLDDAEKLSGWKFNEHSWVWNDRLWNLLKPSRVVYDAMHCIWGNGIACLELGLFWQAASRNGVHRADLSAFLRSNWEQSLQIGNVPAGLASLAGPKLLKDDGSDYRGDSNQTLELVVLMSFFAQQALSGIEGLRDHIASLAALNRLRIAVLNAKLHPEQCPGLLALQEEHLKLFKKCYTAQRCRPKHHYSLHIERQVATFRMLMDTWPTERKHKVFKSDLAPRIKRLDRFERSIMMRWIEHDLSTLARSNFLNHLLQPLKEEVSGLKFGKGAYSKGCTLRTNNVLMFKNGDVWQAFLVVTCFQSKEGLGVIGQQLQLMESDPHMSWSKWILTEEYAPFSFAEASKTLRTSFLSKASDESMLLLRWTKVLLTFVVSMLSRKY